MHLEMTGGIDEMLLLLLTHIYYCEEPGSLVVEASPGAVDTTFCRQTR